METTQEVQTSGDPIASFIRSKELVGLNTAILNASMEYGILPEAIANLLSLEDCQEIYRCELMGENGAKRGALRIIILLRALKLSRTFDDVWWVCESDSDGVLKTVLKRCIYPLAKTFDQLEKIRVYWGACATPEGRDLAGLMADLAQTPEECLAALGHCGDKRCRCFEYPVILLLLRKSLGATKTAQEGFALIAKIDAGMAYEDVGSVPFNELRALRADVFVKTLGLAKSWEECTHLGEMAPDPAAFEKALIFATTAQECLSVMGRVANIDSAISRAMELANGTYDCLAIFERVPQTDHALRLKILEKAAQFERVLVSPPVEAPIVSSSGRPLSDDDSPVAVRTP